MNITDLIAQGEAIYATKYVTPPAAPVKGVMPFTDYTEYVNHDAKTEWEQTCSVFLQKYFSNHPKVSEFEKLCTKAGHNDYKANSCRQQIAILKAFAAINPAQQAADYDSILINIFDKFQKIERQLAHRHDSRSTLKIGDEYDVQDLLHALLKLYFDDIRAEENSPSDAGSSKRLDFLLNDEQIVVEVKMTRDKLKDKEIGDQLKIDIASYKSHPKCKKIYCFVYDKDGLIRNSRGIEKDLEALSTSEVAVRVFIRPE